MHVTYIGVTSVCTAQYNIHFHKFSVPVYVRHLVANTYISLPTSGSFAQEATGSAPCKGPEIVRLRSCCIIDHREISSSTSAIFASGFTCTYEPRAYIGSPSSNARFHLAVIHCRLGGDGGQRSKR